VTFYTVTKPGGVKKFASFNRGTAKGASPEPAFVPDQAYEASPGVKQALAAIDGRTPVVLIAGRAGTGKTRLVQYIKSRPGGELQATVAPTGIAALNAQAQTIHSFFHLEHAVLDARNLSKGGRFGPLYRRMKRLVIDEISMVRADVIDAIDARLRQVRGDKRPFGGVQIVMVGDFLQLPPVVPEHDWPMLDGLGYEAPYAFNAPAAIAAGRNRELSIGYGARRQGIVDILGCIRSRRDLDCAGRSCALRGPHRDGVSPLLLRRAPPPASISRSVTLGGAQAGFRAVINATPWDRQSAGAGVSGSPSAHASWRCANPAGLRQRLARHGNAAGTGRRSCSIAARRNIYRRAGRKCANDGTRPSSASRMRLWAPIGKFRSSMPGR
jgi:hypothetical protein